MSASKVNLSDVKTPPQKVSNEELQAQREAIRRGLLRANAAAAMILAVVVGLALVAVLEATRAGRERARAISAEADSEARRGDFRLEIRAGPAGIRRWPEKTITGEG